MTSPRQISHLIWCGISTHLISSNSGIQFIKQWQCPGITTILPWTDFAWLGLIFSDYYSLPNSYDYTLVTVCAAASILLESQLLQANWFIYGEFWLLKTPLDYHIFWDTWHFLILRKIPNNSIHLPDDFLLTIVTAFLWRQLTWPFNWT